MKLHTHKHTLSCSPAAPIHVAYQDHMSVFASHMFKGGVNQALLNGSMFVHAHVCVSNVFMFVQSNLHYAVFEPKTNQNTPNPPAV